MEKLYKIYKYTSPSGKMYIGQTCNSLNIRAANGEGYKECPKFYQAIQKYGWLNFTSEILVDNLTQDEANQLEEYYINYYNTTDDNYGYNIAKGGLNKIISSETKNKMRISHLGLIHSEETQEKISQSLTNRHLTEEHKKHISETHIGMQGHKFTENEKIIISKKLQNHPSMSKKVHCIETGIVYPSAAEAARQLGLASGSHINECITNPQRVKTAGGFHWERIIEND